LRPLRGEEIRKLEERLPEGRSVRTGLAALTGYTLGLSKALAGVFIYDVITANVSSIESETNNRFAQQVCFNSAGNEMLSRSNDEYEYNPYEDADVYDNLGRQSGVSTDTDTTSLTSTDTFADTDTDTSTDSVGSNVATCIILYRNR